jgi:hypothetical protein
LNTAHFTNLHLQTFEIAHISFVTIRPQEKVMEIISRRRGRPPGSIKVPPDLRAGIWITVRLYRIGKRIRTGKTSSVSQACRELAAQGGIISVVGGNLHALAEANGQRKKRWQRFQLESNGSSLSPSTAGPLFVSHTISNPGTLQARYSEANKLASSDRRVRLAWMNLGRQMLGRPIKKLHWANPWRRAGWRVESQSNIIAN